MVNPMENPRVREEMKKAMIKPLNDKSKVKKVIGIVSGKGGVGKSLVTGLSAVSASRAGYKTAIMDADITGPSIPKMFGVHQKAEIKTGEIYPLLTNSGIEIISLNLLTDNETDPVIWRGPIIGGVVSQFWTDVVWGDIDVMFIDMPPGTGDVALTVFQSIPLDGIIVVTSPQDLVSMIVMKAINMAEMMDIPVLGIVENMSYLECPSCQEKIEIFGPSRASEVAHQNKTVVLDRIPIDPDYAHLTDQGLIEFYLTDAMKGIPDLIKELMEKNE